MSKLQPLLQVADIYLKFLLNACLLFSTWITLIVFSQSALDLPALGAVAGLGCVIFAARLWIAKSTDVAVHPKARNWVYPALVLFTACATSFLVAVPFAFLLVLTASLAWFVPALAQNQNRFNARLLGIAAELSHSDLWRHLCQRFGFDLTTRLPVSHTTLRTQTVLVDLTVFVVAVALFLVWATAPVFSGLVILFVVGVSVWQSAHYLARTCSDARLPILAGAGEKIAFVNEPSGDFVKLDVDSFSTGPVQNFGFELFQGLCLMFVGASGSGKSEVLKSFATGRGSGTAVLSGTHRDNFKKLSESVCFVPTEKIWIPGTITDFMSETTSDVIKAHSVLRDLDPFGDAFPEDEAMSIFREKLSPTQIQIVWLARSFVSDAPILVFEEPETHLDFVSRSGFLALALQAKVSQKILLVSTDDDMLMSLADELVMFDRSEVVDRGPTQDVRQRHRDKFVRASFKATASEAFRLSLWLEALMPSDVSKDLSDRVVKSAEEMLLMAPRDQFSHTQSIIFDAKLGAATCRLNMLDTGDHIGFATSKIDRSTGAFEPAVSEPLPRARLLADSISESHNKGYRQISAVFHAATTFSSTDVAA